MHSRRTRWPLAVLLLILGFAPAASAQTQPRRVLLLYTYEREFMHTAFAGMFRLELTRSSAEPVDYIEVALQSAGESVRAPDYSIVTRLGSTFAGTRLDLVVAIGGPAAAFAQTHREQLFPTTPMLFAAVDRRFIEKGTMTDNDTAVAVAHDPPQMIEHILKLLPDTQAVVVVIGASQLEQFWLREVKRTFKRFEGRLTFVWTNDWSLAELLQRCGALPDHSAIFFGVFSLDAKGVPQIEERTLRELHAVANAPIFGLHSTQLGRGIVGGPLLSIEDLSRNTAKVALRVLRGESPRSIVTPTQVAGVPAFDWRELKRWDIDEDRLDPGSAVQFREPTTWQRYRRPIIVAGAVASVQALIVFVLAANLVKQRRVERSLRRSEEHFRLLSNAAPVMMWTAGPDRVRIDINRCRLDYTGEAAEPGSGNDWTDAIHPDDLARCLETYTQAFNRREPFQAEYRLRRSDGEYRWILDTGAPRFASATFEGYVGSAVDVTDLKLATLALSSLSRRLMQACENERAWVARELHEDLCQRMVALTLSLRSLSELPGSATGEMRIRVAELCGRFSELTGEILSISDRIHARLELLGLKTVARGFCEHLSAEHQVVIAFRDNGVPDDLSNDVALAVFRVLQEAVTNAMTHAAARQVSVSLDADADEVRLDVSDDGVGFDPDAAMKDHGLGLIGMRERLTAFGGHCAISSRCGSGTRILARVPIRRRDRNAPRPSISDLQSAPAVEPGA
jgi:PAS domain S-box-containing protein